MTMQQQLLVVVVRPGRAAADGDNGGPGLKQLFRSQADRDRRRQKRERSTTPSRATVT